MPQLLLRLAMTATALLAPMNCLSARERMTATDMEKFALPFRLQNGFILIPGAVDGQQGYFMLDTGSQSEFLLNRESLTLPPGVPISSGSAASGQAVTIFRHSGPRIIKLGNRRYERRDMFSGNFAFVAEELGQRFLGFVGVGFFGSKTMTIDYRRRSVTFDRAGAKTPEKPIDVLHFAVRNGGPEIALDVGGMTVNARIDTGADNQAVLTPGTRARLLAAGALEETASHASVNLKHICYGHTCFSLNDLAVEDGDTDHLTLGSTFLRRYRSVWRYSRKTIELHSP